MDQRFAFDPAGPARLYFLDFVGWIRDLHLAQEEICRVLSSLIAEYERVFPRSRLALYPKNRPLHGPTSLYWGEVREIRVRIGPTKFGTRLAPVHLRGGFRDDWAYTIAKQSDGRAWLRDFNRRRLALNAAGTAIRSALDFVRRTFARRFAPEKAAHGVRSSLDPYVRIEVPDPPREYFPPGLPSRLTAYLSPGWIAAFSLALAEKEAGELALEVSGNPSADGIRLELAERKRPDLLQEIRWVFAATGHAYPKLTDRLMRKLGVRLGIRPVIAMKERKRRRIEKAMSLSAGALDSLRRKCEQAHLIVSEKLAEAKRIQLGSPDAGPFNAPLLRTRPHPQKSYERVYLGTRASRS